MWVRSLGRDDPLEKEMATQSSSLAWKIPWTEDLGRLQSMGLQRVGHDLVTESRTHNTSPVKVTMNNFCAHTLVYDLSAE